MSSLWDRLGTALVALAEASAQSTDRNCTSRPAGGQYVNREMNDFPPMDINQDLTGQWEGSDGVRYHIRQSGKLITFEGVHSRDGVASRGNGRVMREEIQISYRTIYGAAGDLCMDEGRERLAHAIRNVCLGRDVDSGFRHIFEEFYGPVVRFFRRKNLSGEQSDELAQDVFLFVYTGLRDLRDERLFRAWLFSIARNRFTNYLMHSHAQKRSSAEAAISSADSGDQPEPEIPDSSQDPLALVLEKEKLDRLYSAMNALPEQMRRCVTMRVVEDCKYEEIAQRMGIAVNTVKVHLHKARSLLNDKLSPYFSSIDP